MNKDIILDHILEQEFKRQNEGWNLIASENLCFPEILKYQNNHTINKYAEGTFTNRFYEGCQYINEIEYLAVSRLTKLYNMPYANVQPHCGTTANLIAYMAVLSKGDTVLSMDFSCGGHLSHGHSMSISSQLYNFVHYGVDKESHIINYSEVEEQLKKHKPKLLISGASSYSRLIDYKKMYELAKQYNAIHMIDMAHIAGLIAANIIPSPAPYADIITSTTHKTLRGPRGAFIMSTDDFAKKINRAVMPGHQGGPFMNTITAKAWLFEYAKKNEFINYQKEILKNCQIMINILKKRKISIISNGSDNHLFVINLQPYQKTGKEIASLLARQNIYVNKNSIPYDIKMPSITSGIRIGTPFITSQQKTKKEIEEITNIIADIILTKN